MGRSSASPESAAHLFPPTQRSRGNLRQREPEAGGGWSTNTSGEARSWDRREPRDSCCASSRRKPSCALLRTRRGTGCSNGRSDQTLHNKCTHDTGWACVQPAFARARVVWPLSSDLVAKNASPALGQQERSHLTSPAGRAVQPDHTRSRSTVFPVRTPPLRPHPAPPPSPRTPHNSARTDLIAFSLLTSTISLLAISP